MAAGLARETGFGFQQKPSYEGIEGIRPAYINRCAEGIKEGRTE
jgi:hypothetical protein